MNPSRPSTASKFDSRFVWVLALVAVAPVWAQISFLPSAASTQLYFAQLADGGPASQKWTVTLILTNPGSAASTATAAFFDHLGQPLSLDFGQGPTATLNVTLPAGGTATYTSLGTSSLTNATVGWASVTATNPVSGTVLYRATANGNPMWDVAAAGTGPTYLYDSYANYNLGIALVNPSSTQPIDVVVTSHDTQGNNSGTIPVTLAPLAHSSFNLGPEISTMSTGFTGSITITSTDNPPKPFVAWALNSRGSLLSPLPPGQLLFPSSNQIRAGDVFAQTITAQKAVVDLLSDLIGDTTAVATYQQQLSSLKLSIDSDPSARVSIPGDGKVHVTTAMLELLGDSPSALSFMIGDMLILSFGAGSDPASLTTEADLFGVMTDVAAGYDPNGAAALIGRLRLAQMLNIPLDPTVASDFVPTGAVDGRLSQIWTNTQTSCNLIPALAPLCAAGSNYWH